MKKRILSIVCIVALLATVISVCAVYAFGADEEALVGTGFEFSEATPAVADDWTFSTTGGKINSKGALYLNDAGGGSASDVSATYKETFNLTNGFELTYQYGLFWNVPNYSAGYTYNGAAVGNISADMTKNADDGLFYQSIYVDGTAVANGTVGYTIHGSDKFDYVLSYDPATKTITLVWTMGELTETLTYVDEADAVNVADAAVVFESNSTWDVIGYVYEGKIVGFEPPAPPPALVGTGFEFNEAKPAVAEEWTFSHEQTKINDAGGFNFNDAGGGQAADDVKATYNQTFILTRGFEFSYRARGGTTNNYETNRTYFGAEVGNIFAYLQIADSAKEHYKLVIKIDGEVVATSDDVAFTSKFSTYFYDAYNFALAYDVDTKTVKFSISGPGGSAEVSYVDENDTVDVAEASVALKSNSTWDNNAIYYEAKLVGAKPCTQHTYDDEEDTVCNVCGATREPGEGGEPGDDIVRGEPLTTWAPEEFVEEEWTGHSNKFVDGQFIIPEGQSIYTVWTAKTYDMSEGFTFKGTLKMKNGYNNYYNEWCSAYFGNESENLELRIRNDDTTPTDYSKDNTYTAYLLYKGEEIASSDLTVLPNGEYEFTYADGKITVALGGIAINWTLADGTQTTSVALDATEILYNAKLGLRLSGNYCPNGRKWSVISIEKVTKDGVHTGDSRNIVLPACVMLLSAVAAAVVLSKKKVTA